MTAHIDKQEHPAGVPSFCEIYYRLLYVDFPLRDDCASIRLLKLHKPKNRHDSNLTGDLFVTSLKTKPKRFAALSYVWGGEPSPNYRITCNSKFAISLTRNCYEALLAIRQIYGGITIWVDAICINQQDDREKESQIPLMEDIYTYAQPTLIWLGQGSYKTDKAIDCVRLASKFRIQPVTIPWETAGSRSILRDRYLLAWRIAKMWLLHRCPYGDRRRDKKLCKSFDRVGLDLLLESEWLNRAWTFQEAILACDPVIVRGSKTISWAKFHQGLDMIYDAEPTFGKAQQFKRRFGCPPHSTLLSRIEPWRQLYQLWITLSRPIGWQISSDSSNKMDRSTTANSRARMVNVEFAAILAARFLAFTVYLIPACAWTIGYIHFFLASGLKNYSTAESDAVIVLGLSCFPIMCLAFWSLFGFGFGSFLHVWSTGNDFMMHPREPGRSACLAPLKYWCLEGHKGYRAWINHGRPPIDPLLGKVDISSALRTVQALRDRQSKWAHDKAFAIYGVLRRIGGRSLKADYVVPVWSVYRDLYVALLEKTPEAVNLLVDSGTGQQLGPSWVPNWETVTQRSWISDSFVLEAIQPRLRAAFTPHIISNGGSSALHVRGTWKGSIKFCSGAIPAMPVDPNVPMSDAQKLKMLSYTAQSLSDWFANIRANTKGNRVYGDIGEAALTALYASRVQYSNPNVRCSGAEAKAFDNFYRRMIRDFPRYNPALTDVQRLQEISGFVMSYSEVRSYLEQCCTMFASKYGVFYSPDGGIGAGPPGATVDDYIAQIEGVAVPLILRQVTDTCNGQKCYQVVGPAVISGLMDWRERRGRDSTFVRIPAYVEGRVDGSGTFEMHLPDSLTYRWNDWDQGIQVFGDIEGSQTLDFRGVEESAEEEELEDIILV